MDTEDRNILRHSSCTEFGLEKVEYVWTLLNLSSLPYMDSEVESPPFTSSNLFQTKWCIVLSKQVIFGSPEPLYTVQLKLISAAQQKVRAIPRLSVVCSGEEVAASEAEHPFTFQRGKSWGSVDVESPRLGDINVNPVVIKCQLSILTETKHSFSGKIASPKCSLRNDMQKMLTTQDLCDVTLVCDGKKYPAHKAVLAARSPVFRAMFSCNMKENLENCVEMKDVDPVIIQDMLQYIYTGECNVSADMAWNVLPVADRYQLLGLKKHCEKAIAEDTTVENVINFAVKAHRYDCKKLKNFLVDFIKRNLVMVMETDGWKEYILKDPGIILELTSQL